MARTFRSIFLAIMRSNEESMTALFANLAVAVAGDVRRYADAEGKVSQAATYDIQRTAGERVTSLFLGQSAGGDRAPFAELVNGIVLPLSPYTDTLWESIAAAVRVPVEQQAAVITRLLGRAPEILAALRRARRDPFVVAGAPGRVAEQEEANYPAVFTPNPLATYQAPHLWVDPRGYRLSDRIWQTAGNTRRQLDLFLEQAIAEGRGALAISRDLEQFLLPGRALKRTKKPYGTDASYDAMRLARTEITRAAAQAHEMAAAMNPFVEQIAVVLSPSHPKCDICDEAAAAGPWPKDQIPAQYQIPLHPHCLCSYRSVLVEDTRSILDALREDIRRERAAFTNLVGPVLVDRFVQQLLRGIITRATVSP